MTLFSRVFREKRSVILPLLVGLLINALVYLFVVQPLAARSANVADRAMAASNAARVAEREQIIARDLVSGKARADEELNAFYQKVLPADLTAARRMTYSSLPALARRTNVRYDTRRFDTPEPDKDDRLARLQIRMVVQGAPRTFVASSSSWKARPEFVIIDDVTLTEGAEGDALTLRLDLSTYYSVRPNGA